MSGQNTETDHILDVAEAVWEDEPTQAELDLTRRILAVDRELRTPPGTPGEDAAEPTFGDLAERRRAEEDYYDGMGE